MKVLCAIAIFALAMVACDVGASSSTSVYAPPKVAETNAFEHTIIVLPPGWPDLIRVMDKQTGKVVYMSQKGGAITVESHQ